MWLISSSRRMDADSGMRSFDASVSILLSSMTATGACTKGLLFRKDTERERERKRRRERERERERKRRREIERERYLVVVHDCGGCAHRVSVGCLACRGTAEAEAEALQKQRQRH
jgi:hypothetical protein